MEKRISIVIPNYNSAATIGKCLDAAFASKYNNFEVIVVDDYSSDNSVEIIKQFPCKLIQLESRSGTSKARNTGALESNGEVIFFTDSDCLLDENTLSIINSTLSVNKSDVVIGGTYSKHPYDPGFFNMFQAVFVNYSETKKPDNPDYIAAHAMIIYAETFRKSGGFPEIFLPIIEDVEFSHRLKRSGCRFLVNPDIQVRHIFNFTLVRSMINAHRKTSYWCTYSLKNKDLLTDSGSASVELKTNVVLYCLSLVFLTVWLITQKTVFLYFLPLFFFFNIFVNRNLLKTFFEMKDILFAGLACSYYTLLYPLSVGIGTITGAVRYYLKDNV